MTVSITVSIIHGPIICIPQRLQQEVHSLDKQCREYQLDAEECRLELRNVEQELELSKQEVAKERDERRKEISLANELRIEIEEKLTCVCSWIICCCCCCCCLYVACVTSRRVKWCSTRRNWKV